MAQKRLECDRRVQRAFSLLEAKDPDLRTGVPSVAALVDCPEAHALDADVAAAEAAASNAAVLVLPSEGDAALNTPPEQEPLPRYKDELRSFAAREGLPLIDAQRWFQATRRGDDLFLDVVHPNAEGSKVLAAFMHSQLPADLPMAR